MFGSDLPTRLDVPTVDAFLLKHLPDDDPRGRQAVAAVELIAKDKAVTRVERLADELGLSMRGLQRLFAEYVGIGPKWVIRRYRLHEVTARMAAGGAIDWAALAADLGYADQGHFIRDFKNIFGEPPAWYAQRYQSASPDLSVGRVPARVRAAGRFWLDADFHRASSTSSRWPGSAGPTTSTPLAARRCPLRPTQLT